MRPCGGPWPNTALQCNAESTHTDPSRTLVMTFQSYLAVSKGMFFVALGCFNTALCSLKQRIQGRETENCTGYRVNDTSPEIVTPPPLLSVRTHIYFGVSKSPWGGGVHPSLRQSAANLKTIQEGSAAKKK
eukprot:gene9414-biopygen22721